jgi:hypothetical protein
MPAKLRLLGETCGGVSKQKQGKHFLILFGFYEDDERTDDVRQWLRHSLGATGKGLSLQLEQDVGLF